jgi:hypothetical protein
MKPLAFAADVGELWVLLGRFDNPSLVEMPGWGCKQEWVEVPSAAKSIWFGFEVRSKWAIDSNEKE